MFQITKQRIGDDVRHAVVGEVGSQVIRIMATNEMQACEIARCLNEAAGIEVEELTEIVSAVDLHDAMEEIMKRQDQLGETLELLRGRRAEELAETQLRG